MVCSPISGIESFADFLVWPTRCNYYFYLIIFGGLFLILAWTSFKAEEKRKGEGELISSLGVSSIAITILGLIGTLVVNGAGVPMIQVDILLYMVAVTVVFVFIWIFKD